MSKTNSRNMTIVKHLRSFVLQLSVSFDDDPVQIE